MYYYCKDDTLLNMSFNSCKFVLPQSRKKFDNVKEIYQKARYLVQILLVIKKNICIYIRVF